MSYSQKIRTLRMVFISFQVYQAPELMMSSTF